MTFRSVTHAALLVLLAPGAAASQATVHVPLTDPAYEDAERLLALAGGGPVVLGQRPWSEATFASLVDSLEARLGEDAEAGSPAGRGGRRILSRLRRRFGEPAVGPRVELREVRVDGTWTDSPARRTPPNVEWIEDRTNPLVAYRQGRDPVRGVTLGAEVAASARPTDFLAAYVRPRARAAFASGGEVALGDEARALLLPSADGEEVVAQSLYGRLVVGRLSLLAGRRSVFWGQGPRDGLLVSLNPRAFDMVEVSTERPFRLPWLLGALGPVHGTVFVADLGREDQRFPGSKLVGVKLSARPHPSLEVGVATLNEQGGEGAPDAGLGDRILDVLILPDLLRGGSDFLFSEKLFGVDLRWTAPTSRPFVLYAEAAATDFDVRRFDEIVREDGAYALGAFLPFLGGCACWDLRAEVRRTGARVYRHNQFVSGLTLERDVIGSPLGPDARGGSVEVSREVDSGGSVGLRAALESRSLDLYEIVDEPSFRIVQVSDGVEEVRRRATAWWRGRGIDGPGPGALEILVEAAVEGVQDFAFEAGTDRVHVLLTVGASWRR